MGPAWHNVAPMSPDTRFPWLGDIFAEPAWVPSRNVVSVGDLLLSVGLAWATYLLAAPTGQPSRVSLNWRGVGRPGLVLNR